jgi:hypothetical protein
MATAARTQTIVVRQPQPNRRIARRGGGRRRRASRGGSSPARIAERCTTQSLAYGALSALVFGFLQRKVRLPGITGIPNSLTYGTGAAIVGVVIRSRKMVQAASGPLFAGLHTVGLKGVEGDTVAGEFDETAGEFDREEVTAGEFDDL